MCVRVHMHASPYVYNLVPVPLGNNFTSSETQKQIYLSSFDQAWWLIWYILEWCTFQTFFIVCSGSINTSVLLRMTACLFISKEFMLITWRQPHRLWMHESRIIFQNVKTNYSKSVVSHRRASAAPPLGRQGAGWLWGQAFSSHTVPFPEALPDHLNTHTLCFSSLCFIFGISEIPSLILHVPFLFSIFPSRTGAWVCFLLSPTLSTVRGP